MQLLIIGGTRFVGRALVEAALARGHTLTLFNRGQSGPGLFPDVESISGDREHDLDRLQGRRWDAVIDTCGYVPRITGLAARALADAVDLYVFISTVSVYRQDNPPGSNEDAPLMTLADPTVEEVTGETYGGLKVLCEQAVQDALPGRSLIVRPGLVVGPHDPTGRFTYWPVRVRRGGQVLAPVGPERLTQFIDVRDLAEWTIRIVEQGQTGVYHATGPTQPLTLGEVLQSCLTVTGSDAELVWAPEDFLLEQKVGPFVELPLWLPEAVNSAMNMNIGRAMAAGLTFRPLEQTIRDTLEWYDGLTGDPPGTAGLAPEREAELLAVLQKS